MFSFQLIFCLLNEPAWAAQQQLLTTFVSDSSSTWRPPHDTAGPSSSFWIFWNRRCQVPALSLYPQSCALLLLYIYIYIYWLIYSCCEAPRLTRNSTVREKSTFSPGVVILNESTGYSEAVIKTITASDQGKFFYLVFNHYWKAWIQLVQRSLNQGGNIPSPALVWTQAGLLKGYEDHLLPFRTQIILYSERSQMKA